MPNVHNLNAFVTKDGLFVTKWKAIPPLPPLESLNGGTFRPENTQDYWNTIHKYIPDVTDDSKLLLNSYWGTDLFFYLAFLPRQLNISADPVLHPINDPFTCREVVKTSSQGHEVRTMQCHVRLHTLRITNPNHPDRTTTYYQISPTIRDAWVELATHLQQTFAALRPLIPNLWPVYTALPLLPLPSTYSDPAPTRAIATGRIHDTRRRFIALSCFLILFLVHGGGPTPGGDLKWVEMLREANLPRFWIDGMKKSPFFTDFSGHTLRRGFHVNMSVDWNLVYYRTIFFEAKVPVFFFWPKEIMASPSLGPITRELYPGRDVIKLLPQLSTYIDMDYITSFRYDSLSGQRWGEMLKDFFLRQKTDSEKLWGSASEADQTKAKLRAQERMMSTGSFRWVAGSRLYVWDPIPYPPFHFRRKINSSEANTTLSRFSTDEIKYNMWQDEYDCCKSFVTYTREEFGEDMQAEAERDQEKEDGGDYSLHFVMPNSNSLNQDVEMQAVDVSLEDIDVRITRAISGRVESISQDERLPAIEIADKPPADAEVIEERNEAQVEDDEPMPPVPVPDPNIANAPLAPLLREDQLIVTQPTAEMQTQDARLRLRPLKFVLICRYGIRPKTDLPAGYGAPEKFTIHKAMGVLAERPPLGTEIVLPDQLSACARAFVHALVNRTPISNIPLAISDICIPFTDFPRVKNVHRIPIRIPLEAPVPLAFPGANNNIDPTYFFIHAHDDNGLHAILGLPSVLTFKQVFREKWGPNLRHITMHLVADGIPFSVFWPRTPIYHTVPTIPPLSDTRRSPDHVYTLLDYNAYVHRRLLLFQLRPLLRSALRQGGIVWRLAMESLRPDFNIPIAARDVFRTTSLHPMSLPSIPKTARLSSWRMS